MVSLQPRTIMRTFLLLIVLVLLGGTAQAQDLLTKRNGEELLVKVLEISPNEVKYRRADNPDGPLISVWRTDMFMIRYANGTKELFGPDGSIRSATSAASVSTPTSASATAPSVAATAPVPLSGWPSDAATMPVISNADPNDALLDEPIQLSGPRVGITMLSQGLVNKARESGLSLSPVITQFGWQFETRLFRLPSGVSGLVEFVPLVGGLEQGHFLPSISGIVGIRSAKGMEFGIGPNVTLSGTGVVLAAGTTIRSGGINFPITFAVAPSQAGTRVSLLLGFNARRK